ncbi:MAG: GNAT family N-acetyltransferase [candidate division Zixibacteria bacterium]|nr:GNAT family N-acetyltransferase [candidate division Zixibacteria bacterium]
MFVFVVDKDRLWRHFQKDPALFAYHIGDLDDFFFGDCQWAASYTTKRHPIIEDVILIYNGLKVPTVLAFGVTERFPDLVKETLDILPDRFHCHFQSACGDVFRSRYREEPLGAHYKMRLEKLSPAPDGLHEARITSLDESHLPALTDLYARAYPNNYFMPRMLRTGRYRGLWQDGRLVASAGVHVVSDQYAIATLGNIATDPEYRGRGFGRQVTWALTRELHDEGKLVCLNVRADNAPAIRCYEQIGFAVAHTYQEATFISKA